MADLTAEPVRWDGNPETLELLRERMPECLDSHSGRGVLYVRTLRQVSAKGFVHGAASVPLGWYLTPRTCRVHKMRYAAIEQAPRFTRPLLHPCQRADMHLVPLRPAAADRTSTLDAAERLAASRRRPG